MATGELTRLRRMGALLWPHARVERRWFATGIGLGLVAAALQLLQPWPLKWALDEVTGAHRGGRPPTWLLAPGGSLWTLGALYLAVSLLAAWASYGHTMLLNGLVNRSTFRLRTALFGQILRQPLVFHESRAVGEMVTRVVYDTSRLRRGLTSLLLRVVQPLVLFTLLFVVLLGVNRALGALFCSGGVAALFMMRRRGRRIARAAGKQRKKEGKLAALVADELTAIREIQTFGVHGSAALQRFAGRNQRSLRKEESVRRLSAGLTLRTEILIVTTTALAVWAGAQAVRGGGLTPGDLMLFFSYALLMHRPLGELSVQATRVGRTYASADRLERLARRAADTGDRPGAVPAPPLTGSIHFDAVWYKAPRRLRGGRKWTLRDLSCDLPAGRRIALVGPNGAGKSTLLRMMLGLAEPERGAVGLDGRDLRDYQIETVRRQISVVFQESVFIRQTVRENLTLGLGPVSLDAVREAAHAAGVDQWIEHLPLGYDTEIMKAGHLFSGGERQRLALARAILRGGRIWLLDEPTTGLDAGAAEDLTASLLEITAGRTTLWITHDPGLIRLLDWVIELSDGELAFAGTPADHAAWRAAASGATEGGDPACRQ